MWREHPFEVGQGYRTRCAFIALSDRFMLGETLVFEGAVYSRYDAVTAFFFRDLTGRHRRWDIHDDDDISTWTAFFERI